MRILVTGGTGTISSGIVEASVEQGHEVYYITRGNHSNRNISNAHNIIADVWNEEEISYKLKDLHFDIVVECLVYTVEQLVISMENFKGRCKQYIFISTAGIYNRKQNGRIKEADDKNCTEWDYTKQKIECEQFLMDNAPQFGFCYTIVRPVVTYGNYRVPYPVVSRSNQWTLFERMLSQKPIIACNNVKFSIIHINDFSRAVVGLFGNKKAYYEDFHIATSKNDLYWDQIISVADEILGTRTSIIHIPLYVYEKIFPNMYDELKYNKTTEMLVDDEKICNALGKFEAKVDIKEGMENTINALKQEYIAYNNTLDNFFNFESDMCIYYAIYKKVLTDEEYDKAKEYVNSWDAKKMISVKKAVRNKIIKYYLKKSKMIRKICSTIKKF